ncbi:MAG: hypothetical protein CMF12_13930 [Idiomarina sp.]|uniref:hypothetical protein n=1 Tax=Idiomarina sp. TaxID=1874361 RepID=UPI000C5957F0|nr:hypothetical protein [Idiomarina sp.]MBT43605.1 hypothetical protein [Idiomarina sp.]
MLSSVILVLVFLVLPFSITFLLIKDKIAFEKQQKLNRTLTYDIPNAKKRSLAVMSISRNNA